MFAFCSAKPIWIPKKPNEMFHRPANDCRGLSLVAVVATGLSPNPTRAKLAELPVADNARLPFVQRSAYEYQTLRRANLRGGTPMTLSTIDLSVVILYAIGIFALAQYVSRE